VLAICFTEFISGDARELKPVRVMLVGAPGICDSVFANRFEVTT
jgi:hypothetical protein